MQKVDAKTGQEGGGNPFEELLGFRHRGVLIFIMLLFTVAPPSDRGATVNRSMMKWPPVIIPKGGGGGMNQVFTCLLSYGK